MTRLPYIAALITLGGIVLGTTPAFAVDGVVLIDQNRALSGNVTPGDAPGFPVTISISGSFRLASNLVVSTDTHAIDITAGDSVSIDLNGFTILGSATCAAGSCDGIHRTLQTRGSLLVRNGTIRGMGGAGISAGDPIEDSQKMTTVEGVIVRNCRGAGLVLGYATVLDSVVQSVSGAGIVITKGLVRGTIINRSDIGIVSTGLPMNVLDSFITRNQIGIMFGNGGAYGNNLLSGSSLAYTLGDPAVQLSGNSCGGTDRCP